MPLHFAYVSVFHSVYFNKHVSHLEISISLIFLVYLTHLHAMRLAALPWCPLRHRPPPSLEDPLDIPGSSLGVPSETGRHLVWRIPWTSRDPPLVSRPPCCPEDPLDIPGSSLGVPPDTGPHPVQRIPWTSRDPPSSLGVRLDTGCLQDIPVLFLSADKTQ